MHEHGTISTNITAFFPGGLRTEQNLGPTSVGTGKLYCWHLTQQNRAANMNVLLLVSTKFERLMPTRLKFLLDKECLRSFLGCLVMH